jgi:hypothetical protein
MKKFQSLFVVVLSCMTLPAISQKAESFDLHKLARSNGLEVFNRQLNLVQEQSRNGIQLSKAEGEGLAWITGLEFSEGVIEFDVRGENVKQHSFVGIAFHGVDNNTFDAIYLRPFQFQEQDETLRARMIQYISLPAFPWRTLRADSPGKYENSINPSPDPNAWIRVKVVVSGNTISTYINDYKEPSLVVQKVTTVAKGRVGLYVADTSGGDFANLTITKTK